MDVEKIKLAITKDFLYYSITENEEEKIIKKPNTFTLEKIRKQLKQIEFNKFYQSVGGKKAFNSELEKATIFPFNHGFYLYFIKNGKFILPKEMVDNYILCYCEKTSEGYCMKPEYINGKSFNFTYNEIAGRICRAYNSYIREVELLYRLLQRKDIQVKYTFYWDFEKGIDIVVNYNNYIMGIGCCQDTKRSEEQLVRKHTFTRKDKVPFYEFPISLKNRIEIGDIWIYSDKAVENLIEEMKEDMDNE